MAEGGDAQRKLAVKAWAEFAHTGDMATSWYFIEGWLAGQAAAATRMKARCVQELNERDEGHRIIVEQAVAQARAEDQEAMETIRQAAALVKRDKLDDPPTVAEQARAEERAAIVAWLRKVRQTWHNTSARRALDWAADRLAERE